MTSAFGWLDTNETQRKRMLEVVELFKDEGTVDELGVGSIRDTIADVLFPGTSVLHSRLRYVLFVPWLLRKVASRGLSPQEAAVQMRKLEVKLIYSLLEGNGPEGVIGSQARETLKRMPSAAYWAALRRWELRTWDTTIEGFFRRAKNQHDLVRRSTQADDPGARDSLPRLGVDPHLPAPPDDLLSRTTFDLTPKEEAYLSDRLLEATQGSLLAWLVERDGAIDHDWVWELDRAKEFPGNLASLVDHGRRFHTAIHGAPLLYNLQLAERCRNDELIEGYRAELYDWRSELDHTAALTHWDRPSLWSALYKHNPRLSPLTRRFVDAWLDLLHSTRDVADSTHARELVSGRERQIKGGRARLVNQAALDRWSGRSGLVRLDYRWHVARRLLSDLYNARKDS